MNRIGHTARVVSDVTSGSNPELTPERCQIILEKLELDGLILLAGKDAEHLWALEPQVKEQIKARRREERRSRTLRAELQDIRSHHLLRTERVRSRRDAGRNLRRREHF